ncbi:MmyB family transcriptional regulator [Cellulomonas sp. URHB0016]
MATPLGDFIRAKRDSIQPEVLGLPAHDRRRAPGLRRSELAARAGISVEYLTRLEQGRDRNPSPSVVVAVSDALALDAAEREHVRALVKMSGGSCISDGRARGAEHGVRATVSEVLRLLEPGVAILTNRLGDVLECTTGFELVARGTGILDGPEPNLTRYVFTDPRARATFPDWEHVADVQAFDLVLGPSLDSVERFAAGLVPAAGSPFTTRLHRYVPPPQAPIRMCVASGRLLLWNREVLTLPGSDHRLVVLLPGDERTALVLDEMRRDTGRAVLHAVR